MTSEEAKFNLNCMRVYSAKYFSVEELGWILLPDLLSPEKQIEAAIFLRNKLDKLKADMNHLDQLMVVNEAALRICWEKAFGENEI